jgi:hypothetical protein
MERVEWKLWEEEEEEEEEDFVFGRKKNSKLVWSLRVE